MAQLRIPLCLAEASLYLGMNHYHGDLWVESDCLPFYVSSEEQEWMGHESVSAVAVIRAAESLTSLYSRGVLRIPFPSHSSTQAGGEAG